MIKKVVLLFFLAIFFIFDMSHAAEKTKKLKDGSELVYIASGSFQMGSDKHDYISPAHKVQIDAFYIGRYEVTNAQYKRYCDKTKRKYPLNPVWDSDYFLGKPDYPVINVNWKDAAAYVKWAGGRLPTEAEWEYAARGDKTAYYYWEGEYYDEHISDYVNKNGMEGKDRWQYTSPAGSFPPNPFGLYDMLGNVWEWVADWYDRDYYKKSPEKNPKGPKSGDTRLMKGGGWKDTPQEYTYAEKNMWEPSTISDYVGFRIAASAK